MNPLEDFLRRTAALRRKLCKQELAQLKAQKKQAEKAAEFWSKRKKHPTK